ncbi:hypothetical protein Hanom_Chr16g01429831 [Helianthus anomalus]
MIRVGTNKRIKTMFNGKKGRNGLNNEMVNKYHSNISAKCLVGKTAYGIYVVMNQQIIKARY